MKKIFHSNQVIITSLAIMIAIAGYLNFTDRGMADIGKNSQYKQVSSEFAIDDLNQIVEKTTDEEDADKKDSEDSDTEEKDSEKVALVDEDKKERILAEDAMTKNIENEQVVAKGSVEEESQIASTTDSHDNIGEAVLVSSSAVGNYFYTAKLDREQARARSKEELIEVVEDASLSDTKKEEALNKIVELTSNAERENATELMLEACGYENCVVSITDGKVDVIVDASTITEQEVARIVDIVTRKTGITSRNIVVTPVNSSINSSKK